MNIITYYYYTNLQFPTATFNIRLHYPAVFPPLCSISVYTTLQYSHRYVQYPFTPTCSIPTAMFNIRLHQPAVFPPLCSISVGTVISYFAIWTSLSPLSYYNGSRRTQNTYTHSCWHNKGHDMNNSGHTRNSYQNWKCYKPQYHYGSIPVWIVDRLR